MKTTFWFCLCLGLNVEAETQIWNGFYFSVLEKYLILTRFRGFFSFFWCSGHQSFRWQRIQRNFWNGFFFRFIYFNIITNISLVLSLSFCSLRIFLLKIPFTIWNVFLFCKFLGFVVEIVIDWVTNSQPSLFNSNIYSPY